MKREICDFCDTEMTLFRDGHLCGGHRYCSKHCMRLSKVLQKSDQGYEPLHTSYSNMGAWKVERGHRGFVVGYDYKGMVMGSAILAAFCLLGGCAFYYFTQGDRFAVLGLIIGMATGILVPLLMLIYARAEVQKGPLLSYDASDDVLELLRCGIRYERATERVVFSYEHYGASEGQFNSELNVLVDGKRSALMHHIGGRGPCETVGLALAEAGFTVEYSNQERIGS